MIVLPPQSAATAAVSTSSKRDSVVKSFAIPRRSNASTTRCWQRWRASSTARGGKDEQIVPRQCHALAEAVPGARIIGSGTSLVSGVVYDSRLVQPGDLFAALRGADFDGHQFVRDAEQRGAAALLVESPAPTALPQIQVGDSRAALAAIAAEYYGHPSRHIGVIGITGTDGKTTTSYLVDHILRSTGLRTGMVGTVAIRIGDHEELHPSRQTTPESSDIQQYLRQMVDASLTWAILEATSHGLAMHRLDHVRFDIGAVTNITREHLDFHGSDRQLQTCQSPASRACGRELGCGGRQRRR